MARIYCRLEFVFCVAVGCGLHWSRCYVDSIDSSFQIPDSRLLPVIHSPQPSCPSRFPLWRRRGRRWRQMRLPRRNSPVLAGRGRPLLVLVYPPPLPHPPRPRPPRDPPCRSIHMPGLVPPLLLRQGRLQIHTQRRLLLLPALGRRCLLHVALAHRPAQALSRRQADGTETRPRHM